MKSAIRIAAKYARSGLLAIVALTVGGAIVPAAHAQVGGNPFVGEILAVPYDFAPNHWALCAGQLMPISQNTALFSLLGTTYGGDGKSTFALPDLRGRTPVSSGQLPGGSFYDLGQVGGEEQVTLTVSQLPSHNHPVYGTTNNGSTGVPSGVWATQTRVNVFSSSGNTTMAPQVLAPVGGGQPHDNRSPYLALNYVIALQGIFPARN